MFLLAAIIPLAILLQCETPTPDQAAFDIMASITRSMVLAPEELASVDAEITVVYVRNVEHGRKYSIVLLKNGLLDKVDAFTGDGHPWLKRSTRQLKNADAQRLFQAILDSKVFTAEKVAEASSPWAEETIIFKIRIADTKFYRIWNSLPYSDRDQEAYRKLVTAALQTAANTWDSEVQIIGPEVYEVVGGLVARGDY
ncbi:MAG: hypothetical protein HRF49_08140 [bacterium]|jgi:hypothetical protein